MTPFQGTHYGKIPSEVVCTCIYVFRLSRSICKDFVIFAKKSIYCETQFQKWIWPHCGFFWFVLRMGACNAGPPRLARPTRPGPCLDFGFQYALIRNNRSKKFGVEYWALPGSNSPWRPCNVHEKEDEKTWRNYDNSLSFNYQAGQIFHLLLQEIFKTFNILPPFLA